MKRATTGITATSFWVWLSASLTAALPFVWTEITHQAPSTQQVTAVIAGIGAAFAAGVKVWHDLQMHKLANAAEDVLAAVPAVESAIKAI